MRHINKFFAAPLPKYRAMHPTFFLLSLVKTAFRLSGLISCWKVADSRCSRKRVALVQWCSTFWLRGLDEWQRASLFRVSAQDWALHHLMRLDWPYTSLACPSTALAPCCLIPAPHTWILSCATSALHTQSSMRSLAVWTTGLPISLEMWHQGRAITIATASLPSIFFYLWEA